MGKPRFSRSRGILFSFLFLCASIGAAQGLPVQAHAAEDLGLPYMCWSTGPLDGTFSSDHNDQGAQGWGGDKESVVDRRDMLVKGLDGYKLKPEPEREVLFNSFPEIVDYVFYAEIGGPQEAERINDKRFGELNKLFAGGGLDEDIPIPWASRDSYLNRRPVAIPYSGAIKSYSARWIDPDNPGGGQTINVSAMLRDQMASNIDITAGTTSSGQEGPRLHFTQGEETANKLSGGGDWSCTGTSCSGSTQFSSEPTKVPVQMKTVEQNDGEKFVNNTGEGTREVAKTDGSNTTESRDVNLENIQPSTIKSRGNAPRGYAELAQVNTDSNEVSISLVLSNKHRKDYKWDAGRNAGKLYQRGLGSSVWTYDLVATDLLSFGRSEHLNDPHSLQDPIDQEGVKHHGYRQPALSKAFDLGGGTFPVAADSMKVIKWPVNIEDLNWYLYKLPGENREDSKWLLWVNKRAGKRLVYSAYGQSGVDDDVDLPSCSLDGDVLLRDKVKCEFGGDWARDSLLEGDVPDVYFPFDVPSGGSHRLPDSLLVKQGVESPDDAVKNPPRTLSAFNFVIQESAQMGDGLIEEKGETAEKRFGLPFDPDKRNAYVDKWPNEPIDPNRSYLMVITYYESLDPHKVGAKDNKRKLHAHGSDGKKVGKSVELPERHIRRVICRLLISPAGFAPGADESRSWWQKVVSGITGFIGNAMNRVSGWISSGLRAVVKAPSWGVQEAGKVVCTGLEKVDTMTASQTPSSSVQTITAPDGVTTFRTNRELQSKIEGIVGCKRMTEETVSTCDTGNEFIFEGECTQLPQMRMRVINGRFLAPPENIEYTEYETVRSDDHGFVPSLSGGANFIKKELEDRFFTPLWQGLDDPRGPTDMNRGLTRVEVRWDFSSAVYDEDLEKRINGYIVEVFPDSKSTNLKVGHGMSAPLPKLVWELADPTGEEYYAISGFSVGDLDYYQPGEAGYGSNSLVHARGTYSSLQGDEFQPVGYPHQKEGYHAFVEFVGDLPLAPGFTHEFTVRPYVVTSSGRTVPGPVSDPLILRGDEAICDLMEIEAGVTVPAHILDSYGCPDSATAYQGYVDDEFRLGLLSLTGSDICYDIFSTTPAEFTWDNAIVKRVWAMVWIIAGGVLFSLLVWQGLRMTYDIWLDPQPAVGFRQLLPRFLLALLMAAGSLFICRVVLVLASDLTCYVAQITGMTMWGMIGSSFGAMFGAWLDWSNAILMTIGWMGLPGLLASGLLILLAFAVVGLFMLVILILFIKVTLGMLMRLAMLAVLIAMSPLAFAFYASDSTSHWTQRWVSMFLGYTFQQVMVLIVIFLGGHLVADYMSTGAQGGFATMIIGMVLGLLTLSLADNVPNIVNPSSRGMFSAFGQLGSMALAGTMMAATVGAGAVAGGLRGAMGGGGGGGGGGSAASSGRSSSPGGNTGGPAGVAIGMGGSEGEGSGSGRSGSSATGSQGSPSSSGPGSVASLRGHDFQGSTRGGAQTGGDSSPAGSPGQSSGDQRPPGRLGGALAGMRSGAQAGYRRGAGINASMRDVGTGSFLYRHGSKSDDAAKAMEEGFNKIANKMGGGGS